MFNPLKSKLESCRIILATTSKQRHNLMRQVGFDFEVIASNFEENLDRTSFTPQEYIQETAYQKVLNVNRGLKPDDNKKAPIIIGFDTMALCDDKLYGKPKNNEDAFNTIKELTNSEKPHLIYTAVCVMHKDIVVKFVEYTKVFMRRLSDEQIRGYIETEEPMGHAGSYAIQGIAGSFIEKIEGDYYNVIGVPLCSLIKELEKLIK